MDAPLTPIGALDLAIKNADGVTALMRLLNARGRDIKSPSVIHQWRLRGVPADHCPTVEAVTGVRCELLRPDVDWSVLRATGAPPPVEEGADAGAPA